MSTGGDEATYIMLSHSLEQGRYHDEFLVGTPPHAMYPPATAIWIAFIRRLAGPNLDAVRAANLLLLALTGLLLGDAIRRLSAPWLGVAGVALTALSPPLLQLSGTALSEGPYAFLSTVSCWTALVVDQKRQRRGWTTAAGGAALASFLTRTAGATVVAGVLAWMLVRRRWTHAAVLSLVTMVIMGGWFAYTGSAGGESGAGSTYVDHLRDITSEGRGWAPALVVQAARNTNKYLVALPSWLALRSLTGTVVEQVIWLVLFGLAGAIGFVVLMRKWPVAAVHLLLSGGVLLVWPWGIARLLVPLLPLIIVAVLIGGFAATRSAGRRAQVILPLGFALALLLPPLVSYLAHHTSHRCDRKDPYADSRCFSSQDRSLVAASRWIRDSTAPDGIIATAKPATVFYFSGHRTVPLTSVLRSERGSGPLDPRVPDADWILLSEVVPRERTAAARLLERGCEGLAVRAVIPRTTLLLSRRTTPGSGGDACKAIQLFLSEFP